MHPEKPGPYRPVINEQIEKEHISNQKATVASPGGGDRATIWSIKGPSQRYGSRSLLFMSRVILGIVFLYAGFDKVLHPAAFADVIINYRMLPDVLANLTAIVLPWLEFFLGLALLLGVWLPGAVFLCNLLLVIFLGALVFNLARGLGVYCGCFDTTIRDDSHAPMTWYVIRDGLFLVPAFYLSLHTFLLKRN